MTVKKIINFILSLIFPIECLGCSRENAYLCDDCLKKIKIYGQPPIFEHPLTHLNGIICAADYRQPLLKKAIHNFKFRFIKELAQPLAKILIQFWVKRCNCASRQTRAGQDVKAGHGVPQQIAKPIIIPMPLNKKRLLERGFNQAELIALLFAEHFNYPLLTNAVIRQKNTPHQVGLNKKERLKNVQNAFQIKQPELIKNQIIILIDDVVTTGSTLEEIAKILKKGGVKEVWGLTVAKD